MSDVSYTPGSGINIGDAVLSFLADTTQLDQGIDGLESRVESRMAGMSSSTQGFENSLDSAGETANEAGETIENAMESKATPSIREARGEAALLGEAFGVHLPRHVRSFVAELPGVSSALSAAFEATAVLFVLEAVVKLTEKVTEFVSTTFIYTQAMKDADAATVSLNAAILAQEAEIAKLNSAYDSLTMTPLQLLTKQLDEVNDKIEKQQAAVRNAQDQLFGYRNGTVALTEAQKTAFENTIADNSKTMEVLADQNRNLSTQIQKIYDDQAKKHADMLKKELSDLDAYNEDGKLKTMQTMDEIMDGVRSLHSGRPALPEMLGSIDDFQKYENAARVLGITLKSSLVNSLDEAKRALVDLQSSGKALPAELEAATQKVKELQSSVDHFGQDTPKVNAFFQAFQKGGQQSEAALWGFGDAYGQALAKVFAGEASLGAVMEAATKQFIGQIGQRALVQGMYYFAQGIADSVWAPQKAAADFAAAGEFFAIGAVTSAVAGAIPGGNGASAGGSGVVNPNSPIQTTGSSTQTVSGGTNVQRFAEGGLITHQTLAMIGDDMSGGDAPEAIIPLHQDSKAVAAIADALASRMGGGGSSGHTFNQQIFGHMSVSQLKSLTRQITREVNRGTLLNKASHTQRVVKRSA